jgi:hypothetical protein
MRNAATIDASSSELIAASDAPVTPRRRSVKSSGTIAGNRER